MLPYQHLTKSLLTPKTVQETCFRVGTTTNICAFTQKCKQECITNIIQESSQNNKSVHKHTANRMWISTASNSCFQGRSCHKLCHLYLLTFSSLYDSCSMGRYASWESSLPSPWLGFTFISVMRFWTLIYRNCFRYSLPITEQNNFQRFPCCGYVFMKRMLYILYTVTLYFLSTHSTFHVVLWLFKVQSTRDFQRVTRAKARKGWMG